MSLSCLCVCVALAAVQSEAPIRAPVRPFEIENFPGAQSRIDELVLGDLRRQGLRAARFCSDEVYVRRLYLDTIGTLPTADEVRGFLDDRNPYKRRQLVDKLLQRREFADYWAMKWCDVLRVKSEYPINLWPNAVQGYHRWIRKAIAENMPYDVFVREMLTASGSNFRQPQVNFYRAIQSHEPQAIAQAVALSFMGVRPERWPAEKWTALGQFFSRIAYKATGEWKEEIVHFDLEKGAPAAVVFPDGSTAELPLNQDPRKVFADWLIAPKNPWFARNAVNRVWAWLMGRGIVHEADDIRPDNPPSNPELIAYLEKELVDSKYDMRRIYKLILSSRIYNFSSISPMVESRADPHFARYVPRRLDAEVLIDAICQITATKERYSSPIPEPFSYIPEGTRSIGLADASISSPFLETFGRSPRDTGLEAERNNRPSAAQRLTLLNSSHILNKLEDGALIARVGPKAKSNPRDGINEIYLTILSRYPTESELKGLQEHFQKSSSKGRDVLIDLAWALMNSYEFQYRH